MKKVLIDSDSYSIVRPLLKSKILIHNIRTPVLIDNNYDFSNFDLNQYEIAVFNKTSLTFIDLKDVNHNIISQTENFIIL